MQRRVLRVLLLLAAVSTLLALPSSAQSSTSGSSSIFTNSSVASSSSGTSKSQCEICRDGGDCSQAYNGAAGKFCNSWLDRSNNRRACCCPASDVCSSDNTYECTCQHASKRPSYWIWIGLGVFALGALIAGGIFTAMKKRRMRDNYETSGGVAYPQQPVYAQGGYAQQGYAPGSYSQPVYAQGGYAQPTYVQPGYGHGGDYRQGGRGGMGTGGAVAMGAAGGLLGGLLIGEALGDMGGDGGGGGEFGGDF
ncbi:hypothetical protein PHYBOEH_011578 [Phytophthora boehmeriae]|uniref:Uncharacterized protein n=1 Tax=Phytophthora boehmeriae TaxID=109152 RepID=A0A8T1VIV7_9STRA|nr:hypothetical protein PHYBOEH_011578 [Phytophthora boehmeriae]